MKTETIHDNLLNVISLFVDLPHCIDENMEIRKISGWDSLATINVVISLEEKFGITIPLQKFVKFNKINEIVEYIESHL